MKVLVIIPAYNEAANIEAVVDRLVSLCPEYDYVVVNDCSTDGTLDILRDKGYRHLSLPVNLGIGGGVQCGYRYAVREGYDVAVQMDGDGQHDPAYIARLIAPIAAGEADMVIGSRFLEKEGFQTSSMRRAGIRVIRWIIRALCGVTVTDTTSGFRATNRVLTEYFAENYAQDYPEPEAIVSATLAGYCVAEVPVVMQERMGGKSSINMGKSVYYMVKVSLSLLVNRLSMPKRKGHAE